MHTVDSSPGVRIRARALTLWMNLDPRLWLARILWTLRPKNRPEYENRQAERAGAKDRSP